MTTSESERAERLQVPNALTREAIESARVFYDPGIGQTMTPVFFRALCDMALSHVTIESERGLTPRTDAAILCHMPILDAPERVAIVTAEFARQLERELRALSSAGGPWQPIETAPLGKMVRLIGGGWRHEWCGQVIDHETGECILDSPTPEHAVGRYFARYWKEFDMPPAAPKEPKA